MTKIICDSRELRSPVVKELDKLNVNIQIETLEVGDYVLSDRVKVERKAIDDFFNSLFVDRKLFGQLFDLSNSCERPLLIIEAYEAEMFTARRIDARAVDGILNSIALMRIPIRYSVNPAGTAQIMASIASKEQNDDKRTISYHGKRSTLNSQEQLTYTLSSVPDIGTAKAKNLLAHFKSLKAIANSDIEQLCEVDLIGKPTAKYIKEYFERSY